ncbi:hypothetical protein GFV12_07955 [Desulfurobacterium thermolithotrophum]|uniref:hypothetical protein n=1 Tax=Desulfurobacterium thermolithotrophum TaxID=64160 RepID=UPI0013CF6C35|nr:hypothetical protein [Desulfurobacterium thermolithotrophum]
MKIFIGIFTLVFFQKIAFAGIFYPLSQLRPSVEKKLEKKILLPKIPELHLEGVVKGRIPVAIINGKYLGLGDRIEGCEVTKIEVFTSSVNLKCDGLDIRLNIDLLKRKNIKEGK